MNEDQPALELERVSKRYRDVWALRELDLRVGRGMIYGFLGQNGAGKTTTIRLMLDIYQPTSGRVAILGHRSALEVRNRIGYLPEEKGLYRKMRVWAVIAYFASLKGVAVKVAKRRALEMLERYGLGDVAMARAETLSKGMGQKVQLLATIAHDPELVILDEPFSGLDPVNQQLLENIIQELAGRGKTILFSTHVMQHAERLCQRFALLSHGRKIFDGTLAEAKRCLPRRVVVQSEADVSGLEQLAEVVGVERREAAEGPLWDFQIREDADAQVVLQACFARGIRLRQFQEVNPTLHDVFVHLVQEDATGAAR